MYDKKIRSVIVDGVEYRCIEYQERYHDYQGPPIIRTRRTEWLSKTGEEISDLRAMQAIQNQQDYKAIAKKELMSELWEKWY